MILQHPRRKKVLRERSFSYNFDLLGFWLCLQPLYVIQAAVAACAAVDGEVRFFCDGGGQEDCEFVSFAVADACVVGHGLG